MEGTAGEGMVGCFIRTQKSHKKWMGKMKGRKRRSRRTVNMEEEKKWPHGNKPTGRGKRMEDEGRREEEMPKEATTKKVGGEEEEHEDEGDVHLFGIGIQFCAFCASIEIERSPPPPPPSSSSVFPAMPMPMPMPMSANANTHRINRAQWAHMYPMSTTAAAG
jgi:hypothetical protein